MGLFSRSSGDAEAVHARVADGEHLWLAVQGADAPLALLGDGLTLEVPAEAEGDLLTAVYPLAASWPGDGAAELRLVHGRRQAPVAAALVARPASPTVAEPPTRDGRRQLSVHEVDGAVVVRRTGVAASLALRGLRVVDGGVELSLDDGRTLVVGTDPGPAPGDQRPLLVDGLPVVRARNLLDRPNFAVALPPLPDPATELRWLKDGRLAVVRP